MTAQDPAGRPAPIDESAALRARVEMLHGLAEELAYQAHFGRRDAAAATARAEAAEARLAELRALPPVKLALAAKRLLRRGSGAPAPAPAASAAPAATYPVVIIVRDRVDGLRRLVGWLERAGHVEIVLVDNASTYPPLVEYLRTTPHRVVRLDQNLGHRAPWLSGVVAEVGFERPFVVSDPDVVPDDDCPLDAIAHLQRVLDAHPGVDKVGLGLRIDDLPAHYAAADDVRRWEAQWWRDEVSPGVFRASVDTTFALYRPGRWHRLDNALRTGAPYVARHLPWYADSANPTDEDRYYQAHLDVSVNTWNQGDAPERVKETGA